MYVKKVSNAIEEGKQINSWHGGILDTWCNRTSIRDSEHKSAWMNWQTQVHEQTGRHVHAHAHSMCSHRSPTPHTHSLQVTEG